MRQGPGGNPQLLENVTGPECLVGNRLNNIQGLGGATGVTTQQCGRALGVGRNGGQWLIQVVGEAGGEVAQHVPVGVDRQRAASHQYLRARTMRLMIRRVHVDTDPKAPPANTL